MSCWVSTLMASAQGAPYWEQQDFSSEVLLSWMCDVPGVKPHHL